MRKHTSVIPAKAGIHTNRSPSEGRPIRSGMTKRDGFTLIELLVAITIVAILSTIALTLFGETQKLARDTKRKADLTAIARALEQYKAKNGSYPVAPCNGIWSDNSGWTATNCGLSSFIGDLPKDPLNNQPAADSNCASAECHKYLYCAGDNGGYYIIAGNLESGNDEGNPPKVCNVGGTHRFWIPSQL